MLTIEEIAIAVGRSSRRIQDYLPIALNQLRLKRDELIKNQQISDDDIFLETVSGKAFYHPIIIQEIQLGINHANSTRYKRSSNTRRQSSLRECWQEKSAHC